MEEIVKEIESQKDVISLEAEIQEQESRSNNAIVLFGLMAILITYIVYALMIRCKQDKSEV